MHFCHWVVITRKGIYSKTKPNSETLHRFHTVHGVSTNPALISNNPPHNWPPTCGRHLLFRWQILHTLDIAGFFSSVVGGDTTAEKKPHPLPLLSCLRDLSVRPGDAVLIGDSGADVGAARAAGVPVILVPDGYTGEPAASLGADYVVEKLADIPESLLPRGLMRRSA